MLKASSPFPNNLNQLMPIASHLPPLEGLDLFSILTPLMHPSYLLISLPSPHSF